MKTIEKTIIVNVPLRHAYNQWTQFEEFPHFMEGVKEVKQLDDKSLHWEAEIAGKSEKWNAEITEQIPDRRIAWRSTSGAKNMGAVNFSALGENQTQLSLEVGYEPEGMVENLGDMLGLVSSRIFGDLSRFKDFIETKHTASDGWRGEIPAPTETSSANI
jgi:uncharacterized membrane protein